MTDSFDLLFRDGSGTYHRVLGRYTEDALAQLEAASKRRSGTADGRLTFRGPGGGKMIQWDADWPDPATGQPLKLEPASAYAPMQPWRG